MAQSWIRFLGVGVLGAILAMILQRIRGEYAAAIRIAAGLLCAAGILYSMGDLTRELDDMMRQMSLWEYAEVLLRALGVAILTQFCAGVCRDCGEQGIGGFVETVGKCEILMLCLPLLRQIVEDAARILSLA